MHVTISYTSVFMRQFNKLSPSLRDEIQEKINLFKNTENHKGLKVHKLKGSLKNRYSFSVNYSHRILFCYLTKQEIVLLTVGSHDVYK